MKSPAEAGPLTSQVLSDLSSLATSDADQSEQPGGEQPHGRRNRDGIYDTQPHHIGTTDSIGEITDVPRQARVECCQDERTEITLDQIGSEDVEAVTQLRIKETATQIKQADIQSALRTSYSVPASRPPSCMSKLPAADWV